MPQLSACPQEDLAEGMVGPGEALRVRGSPDTVDTFGLCPK